MIAAARAERIEVGRIHALLDQICGRGTVLGNGAGGRDVIGRDAVAEHHERARVEDIARRARRLRHAVEIRRTFDVLALLVPCVTLARGYVERAPSVVAGEDVGITRAEGRFGDGFGDGRVDLGVRGPNVAQEDRLPRLIDTERLRGEIDIHPARQRIRDDQRRRSEIVGAHLGMDAAFEIAIAREHRGYDHIFLGDGDRHVFGKRTAIADARRAAVADERKAEHVEVLLQAGFEQIVGDDFRARREAGLDPGLAREPALDGLLREQARAEHDGRVRRIRARGDRCDDDGAVGKRHRRMRSDRGAAAAFGFELRNVVLR